jgi:hypothetical protein
MAQVVEHLLGKCEALNSNTSTKKQKQVDCNQTRPVIFPFP